MHHRLGAVKARCQQHPNHPHMRSAPRRATWCRRHLLQTSVHVLPLGTAAEGAAAAAATAWAVEAERTSSWVLAGESKPWAEVGERPLVAETPWPAEGWAVVEMAWAWAAAERAWEGAGRAWEAAGRA